MRAWAARGLVDLAEMARFWPPSTLGPGSWATSKSMPGRPASDDRPDWAIQKGPSLLEQELWRKRGVHIFDVPIDEFVTRLLPPPAA